MPELVYDEEFRVYSTESLNEFNTDFINHTRMCFDRFKDLFDICLLYTSPSPRD